MGIRLIKHIQFNHVKKLILVAIALSALSVSSLWLYFNYSIFEDNTGYLKDYFLFKGPLSIADSASQSSGLAFNADKNQLYVIVNQPPQIHILSAKGEYIRKIDLQGFQDTEGIAYIGNKIFAVISEQGGFISLFTIHDDTKLIKFDAEKVIQIIHHPSGNTGLEGITYSSRTNQFFVVKERHPKIIFSINWPITDNKLIINHPWDAEAIPWQFIRGLSGITFNHKTGHLFVLSRRSRRVIEYTLSGEEVGSFSLKIGSAHLQHVIGKAEGIVISPDGTLYLCAEPNQLYIFKNQQMRNKI